MAKGFSPLLKKLLAIGVKEHAKTASEAEIGELLKIGVAMDEGESEGADAEAHPKGCKCGDCMGGKDAKDGKGKDAKAEDARKRMHDALDRMLDSKDDEQEALDADMEQLRGLLSGGAGSEKTKNTHGVDGEEESEAADGEEEGEGEDSDEDEEGEGADEAVQSEAAPPLKEGERSKSPAPSAVDAATVLKALKPFVAKANDKRLNKAFDTAMQLTKGTAGKSSKGGYAAVSRASKAVGKDAADQLETRNKANKIAEDANAEYRKMRGVNTTKK